MKQVIQTEHGIAKVWTDDIEESARKQIEMMTELPFIHKHIAVMPDVHAGIGSTVGTVIPTHKAIIPAAVGVDIGCGMMATRLNIRASDLPDNLATLRRAIEHAVPHGRTNDGQSGDTGAWSEHNRDYSDAQRKYFQDVSTEWMRLMHDKRYAYLNEKYPKLYGKVNTWQHLGTLGTGNHFVEVCLEHDHPDSDVWIVLHSGSRGIGNRIGKSFIELAQKEMERWFIRLPNKDLAYLAEGTEYFNDYCKAVSWAQDYARTNRSLMMKHVIEAVSFRLGRHIESTKEAINCHHNYVEMENHFGANVWVTRKGAVRARKGDLGIIPGSMGACTYIVEGLGNEDSFHSCSHGAGRKMGRKQAMRYFTVEDLIKQTEGVECRKDEGVLDEIPGCYKDIDIVMENQKDLVRPIHTLRQVICVKG